MRSGSSYLLTIRRVASAFAVLIVVVGLMVTPGSVPAAHAAMSGPGGASVTAGNARAVTITTDTANNVAVAPTPGGPGIAVGRTGSNPSFTFLFQVPSSTPPGSYSYTFTDLLSTKSFTLTVNAAPPTTTTTTTTQPPTTTSTTSTTTTTQPPTTTSTTTTTIPETTTTTTSIPETTTTQPPTTTSTTTSTTTTTTIPPTTTTSTLVPSGIAAAGAGGGSDSNFPIFAVGGVVLLGLVGAGIIAIRALGSPSRAMSPSLAATHRRRSEQRKTEKRSTTPKSGSGLGEWWRGTALVVGYREWRGRRAAEKKLQRRIKERRRLDGT